MCFSQHWNVLIVFYIDTTERKKKKTTNIDYLRRTGVVFSLSNIFNSQRNAVI